MKKFFKFIGIGIFSIFLFIVGISIYSAINTSDYRENLEPFINKAIPIISSWELEKIKPILSDEGYAANKPEQWKLFFKKASTLGKLQSIGEIQLNYLTTKTPFGGSSITYSVFLIPVTYDTGNAHIQLWLQSSEGEAKVNKIKLLSDLLLQ